VQRLLGHRNLHTTQIYTRVSASEVIATHRKAHPRSRSRVRACRAVAQRRRA
jgi:site-specific recombinase XerC